MGLRIEKGVFKIMSNTFEVGIIHLVRTQNFPKSSIVNAVFWKILCTYQINDPVSFAKRLCDFVRVIRFS